MDLKQFKELLDQYEVNELTADIIYNICIKFKSLSVSEKGDFTWEQLNDKLGKFKPTGEGLRVWVKDKQYDDGTIAENPLVLKQGKTPDSLTADEIEEKYNSKIEQLYKQKVRTQKVVNDHRRIMRSQVAKEDLHNAIIEAVKLMDPIELLIDKQINGTKEAIVMISDWHIGNSFNLFTNSYNVNIAQKRIEKYIKKILHKCEEAKISKVNVVNLGDSVNGSLRATNRIQNELDLPQQIMQASELVAQFVCKLAEKIPEVTYRSVLDNHGRLTANYNESIREENVTVLMNWYLEERLKNTKVQFPHDNLDASMMHFTLNNGKKIVGIHGDEGSGINSIVQEIWGATKEFTDFILCGHLHQEKEKMYQGTRVIMCNSLMGTDQYARSKNLYGEPSQTMLVFDNDGDFEICVTTFEDVK